MKATIKKMLRENTGVNMLDSGGAYGRNWQKNQKRKFENENKFIIEEDYALRNIYFYLVENLKVTVDSKKFQRIYNRINKGSEECYMHDIYSFIDYLEEYGYLQEDNYLICKKSEVINTYNYENCLSQTLQYAVFYNENKYFIVLQIHGGCDARGGYTKPKVFELEDYEKFYFEQFNYSVETVKNKQYYTDDCYNFYNSDDSNETLTYEELYKIGILHVY